MLCYFVIGFLIQAMGVRCIDDDEVTTLLGGIQNEDTGDMIDMRKLDHESVLLDKEYSNVPITIWNIKKLSEGNSDLFKLLNAPTPIPDWKQDRNLLEISNMPSPIPDWKQDRDLLKIPNIPSPVPDWKQDRDLLKIPNIPSPFPEWEKDSDLFKIPTLNPYWKSDLDNQLNKDYQPYSVKKYSAIDPFFRIPYVICSLITLILAPIVIYKRCKARCNARKALTAVVIIRSKSNENGEPLLDV